MHKIVNMTPHPINMLDEEGNEFARFESVGQIRLAVETVPAAEIDGIPTSVTKFGDPVGLPDISFHTRCLECGKNDPGDIHSPDTCPHCGAGTVDEPDVYYIVSQLVKSALPDRDDLLVPAEVVRDETGRIVGCRSLGR